MEYLREEGLVGIPVLPVEVLPRKPSAVVSDCHAVGIEHGYYFEDNILPHGKGLLGRTAQPLDEALHHVRSVGLSRMRSSRNEDASLAYALLVVHFAPLLLQALVNKHQRYF